MRGTTLALLTAHLSSMFVEFLGGDTFEIFGVRMNSKSSRVTVDTRIFLTVFGTDLPRDGYFLTSTDRCEDSEEPDIVKKKINLKTDAVFSNAVRLEAPDGVPFSEKFSDFLLCHKEATTVNRMLLKLTADGQDDTFFPIWLVLLICAVTLILSAYCSGANFAYMRMSINDVALIMDTGEEPHKTHARKIYKYRRQSNWLICTMAVMNILVNTIFTIQVAYLVGGKKYGDVLKFIIPTLTIVLFAEILPQSISNRSGLMLAAKTRHITLILFIICAPVAWPLSKFVDFVLGREVREIYSEEKLKALIKVQSKKMEEAAQGDILARIADFPKKTVQDMMTQMEDTFVVSDSEKLDTKLLVTILEKGFTRIPVFEEKNRLNLKSVLNVKDLATVTIDHRSTVQQFMSHIDPSRTQMRFVLAAQRGEAVMNEMMKGEHHLCAVIKFSYGRYRIVGLITFEDVIEEVFGDIEDDSDKMWNNRRAGIHKDQQTLDWFRTPTSEQPGGLSVNATLKLIQCIFDACPLLMHLGYDVLLMKGLLRTERVAYGEENEILTLRNKRKLLIFFDGTITVEGAKVTTYRLDPNRADFRPYMWGKSLVKQIFRKRVESLSCLNKAAAAISLSSPVNVRMVTRAIYFELSELDLLNGLRAPEDQAGYDDNQVVELTATENDQGPTSSSYAKMEEQSTQISSRGSGVSREVHGTPDNTAEADFHKVLTPRRLRVKLQALRPGQKLSDGMDPSSSEPETVVNHTIKPSLEVTQATRTRTFSKELPSKEIPKRPSKGSMTKLKKRTGSSEEVDVNMNKDVHLSRETRQGSKGESRSSKELQKSEENPIARSKKKGWKVFSREHSLNMESDQRKNRNHSSSKRKRRFLSFLKRKTNNYTPN